MRRRWPLAAAIAIGLALGQAAAPALTQQVAAIETVPGSNYMMKYGGLITFPCELNSHRDPYCELDTGATTGVFMSSAEAELAGVTTSSSGGVITPQGWSQMQMGTVRLTVGNVHATVQAIVEPTWQGTPLVGIAALRAIGVTAFAVQLNPPTLILVTPPAGGHG